MCVLAGSLFLLTDKYRINEAWVAFTLGSILSLAFFLRAYRGHLKQPFAKPFLVGMAIVHGIIFAVLIKRGVSLFYWIPIYGIAISAAMLAVYRLFGVLPSSKGVSRRVAR